MQPKLTPKQKQVEAQKQRKQEIKEYKEMEQEGGGWNVVVSKKKTKTDEPSSTPVVEDSNKKAKKKDNNKKDDAKEIKNRVNNELKNEENIKAVIEGKQALINYSLSIPNLLLLIYFL